MIGSIATINLWGDNFWQERREIVIQLLRKQKLRAEDNVILALQEVKRGMVDPTLDIATALGFSEKNIHFFPTTISGDYGLAIVTMLPVVAKDFIFFTYDSSDPLEFGERGIAFVKIEDEQAICMVGVTHLSVSETMQYIHAVECLNAFKSFILNHLSLSAIKKKELMQASLTALHPYTLMLLAGDFNAAPMLPLYELFSKSGLLDYTQPLHKMYGFSWPADPAWVVRMHEKTFGKGPPFNPKKLQRWMDYIWGCGFTIKKELLLGRTPQKGMYASDHLIPAIYFA